MLNDLTKQNNNSIERLQRGLRQERFTMNWQSTSLSRTVRQFAGSNPRVYNSTNEFIIVQIGKKYFENPTTAMRFIYEIFHGIILE